MGRGTTVTVTLPVEQPRVQLSGAAGAAAGTQPEGAVLRPA
jgi:hypothetical protein